MTWAFSPMEVHIVTVNIIFLETTEVVLYFEHKSSQIIADHLPKHLKEVRFDVPPLRQCLVLVPLRGMIAITA